MIIVLCPCIEATDLKIQSINQSINQIAREFGREGLAGGYRPGGEALNAHETTCLEQKLP